MLRKKVKIKQDSIDITISMYYICIYKIDKTIKTLEIMKNSKEKSIEKTAKNLQLGQIFEAAKQKLIITDLDETSVVLTVLKVKINRTVIRNLKGPNGETISQPVVDNTPELTDSTRRFSRETFAHLILNKTFAQTRLARYESFADLKNLDFDRFLVKQPVKM